MKQDFNQVITGFEFNLHWFVTIVNLSPLIKDPEKLVELKQSNPEEYEGITMSLYNLISDCSQLVNAQCPNFIENLTAQEPHTSDKEE